MYVYVVVVVVAMGFWWWLNAMVLVQKIFATSKETQTISKENSIYVYLYTHSRWATCAQDLPKLCTSWSQYNLSK